MARHCTLVFVWLLTLSAGAIWTKTIPSVSVCYGDVRDYYFRLPLFSELTSENSPFPPNKCRQAYDMLEQIQQLRVVMDKCDQCMAGISEVPLGGTSCRGGLCFEGSSCTKNYRSASAVCGPCPVGFDGNGTYCTERVHVTPAATCL
ncbi:thrombospondin-3a-like [Wyeomyia smithii]|uniref:thrombospondin-3a-like n=1 Tax=Wyeomyia smithii TaxID=174621 RepID=UPI002467FCC9|nr:thrombospondin-3a-like [Wyeomyia smithii]